MNCPKCKKGEIKPAGTCPMCGHGIVKSAQVAYLPFPAPDNILSFPAVRVKQKSEPRTQLRITNEKPIPSWRLEVSQKVQQVLRARENNKLTGVDVPTAPENVAVGSGCGAKALCTSGTPPYFHQPAAVSDEPSGNSVAPVSGSTYGQDESYAALVADSGSPAVVPTPRHFKTLTLETQPPSIPISPVIRPARIVTQGTPDGSELRLDLENPTGQLGPGASDFNMAFPPDPFLQEPLLQNYQDHQGILLSRTLSGLIDFITLLFSSIPFFFTLVYLLGYEDIDSFELWVLLGVCAALFFLYSVFFVTFSGQTIGMMITNLQVVDNRGDLPSCGMAFRRALVFLLALVPGGLGLAWGIVDRKKRCLQDLMSRTTVIRIDSADLP